MPYEETTSSGVKVTVVVPVHNPGDNIEALIASLAGQSLPPAQLEVIFVDDGSTDDTPARLSGAASEHPNMRVVTIPNSGWPGRPRNVGTDQARGEYVFYCDHDDELFPEALERMYDLGRANDADIVYGKVVRTGRPTPYWPLAQGTIGRADPVADQLVVSRTVHKLFRSGFVREHGLRFPEGKVRLEDHNFMGQALPRARTVSVLADYPCYRWIHRTDGSNNSDNTVSPARYWGYFGQALDVFAQAAGEGPLLDSMRVVATTQAFARFAPAEYLDLSPKRQRGIVEAVGPMMQTHAPAALDGRLGVMRRVRVQALRAGDKALFDALQAARLELDIDVVADQARWRDGVLHVGAVATLRSRGAPAIRPTADADSWQLCLGADLDRAVDQAGGPEARRLRPEDLGRVELTVRHRQSGIEWPLPCTTTRQDSTDRQGARVPGLRVQARIDPLSGTFDQRLEDGIWDVQARADFLGEGSVGGLPYAGRPPAASRRPDLPTIKAYVTKHGKLSIKVGPGPTGSALATRAQVSSATWLGGHLSLSVSGVPPAGARVVIRRRGGTLPDPALPSAPIQRGQTRLDLANLGEGWHDVYLRVETVSGVLDERLRLGTVTITQHAPYAVGSGAGALAIRRLGPDEAVPADLVSRPARPSARPRWHRLDALQGRLVSMIPASARPLTRRVRQRLALRK